MRTKMWFGLIGLSVFLLLLDLWTGPYILFPITFVIPVGLAAWYLGRRAAFGFAVILSSCRGVLALWENIPGHTTDIVLINGAIRMYVLLGVAYLINRLRANQVRLNDQMRGVTSQLAAIVENAQDGVLSKDLNGVILTWNAGAERIMGYSASEIIGQSVRVLFPPDHADEVRQTLASIRNGERVEEYDSHRRRKDGKIITVSVTVSPIQDTAGVLVGASTIFRDVSIIKQAEQRFQRIVESAPDAVVIIDSQGRIILVNSMASTIFGYKRSELIGQVVEILLPESVQGKHVDHRTSYIASPKPRSMGAGLDLYGRRKNGATFPVEVSLTPIETEEDMLVVGTIRDITERKQAERTISESLRQKEMLLREIHHRVKNNLAVVGSLFYLQSTRTEDAQTLRILNDCIDRVRSMAMVHEQLYRSADFSQIDFAQYVADLGKQLHQNYVLTPESISLSFELEAVGLDIDRAISCGLVLNELISNALKHAFPDGQCGHVTVYLRKHDGHALVLGVVDTGVGMPVEAALKKDTLGMLLVRTLAKQLDGRVEFIHRSPGTEARLILETYHVHKP